MLKRLSTILVVTAVALAIWIVAEAESVRTETFNPTIAANPAGAQGYMARPDPSRPRWPAHFAVTAEGSAGALDALDRVLSEGVWLAAGQGLRTEPGSYEVDLRSALSSLDAIDSTGAAIAAVDPPRVWVELAEQDSITLPIELARDGLSLDGDPSIRPAEATIKGPRPLIDLLSTQTSRATVQLRPQDLEPLIPGRLETVTGVPVRLPAEIPAGQFWGSIDPPTADVSLILLDQVIPYTLRSVTVLLAVAPIDYNDWDVFVPEQSRVLRDVTLSGPSDIIEQFRREELRVDAFVRLTFEDLEEGVQEGTITRPAIVGPLPPGVTYSVADPPMIELQVRRRPQPPPQPEEPSATPDA